MINPNAIIRHRDIPINRIIHFHMSLFICFLQIQGLSGLVLFIKKLRCSKSLACLLKSEICLLLTKIDCVRQRSGESWLFQEIAFWICFYNKFDCNFVFGEMLKVCLKGMQAGAFENISFDFGLFISLIYAFVVFTSFFGLLIYGLWVHYFLSSSSFLLCLQFMWCGLACLFSEDSRLYISLVDC